MIWHTGYLTFGRKIKDTKNPYREKKPKTQEKISMDGMPLRGWKFNGNWLSRF
jgi:hypothetical protein